MTNPASTKTPCKMSLKRASKSKRWLALTTLLLASLFCGILTAQTAKAQNQDAYPIDFQAEPVELVTQVSDALFANIRDNRQVYLNDISQLHDMLNTKFLPLLDKERAARLILARHSRGVEPEKIKEFGDALIDQLIERYADGLLEFNARDNIEILPLAGNNTDRATRVKTRITLNSGEKAPVDYVLRKTDEGWRAFDVIIEGISYIATYRAQFHEEISRDGFDTVLERLEKGEIGLDTDKDS